MRVLIFGDSIAQGYYDSEGGWVNRLRRYYEELKVATNNYELPSIFNLGVSGDSSNELLNRLENEIRARVDSEQETAIIFSIGINDSRVKKVKNFSDTRTYRQNLTELLKIAHQYSSKIIFIGLSPCVESRTSPVAWGTTVYSNARIKRFDETQREFCKENKVIYVPIFDGFMKQQAKIELLPDGLHPNNQGHELIFELIRPAIDRLADKDQ